MIIFPDYREAENLLLLFSSDPENKKQSVSFPDPGSESRIPLFFFTQIRKTAGYLCASPLISLLRRL